MDIVKYREDYNKWLKELKTRFRQSQIKASVRVNSELLSFYWDFGKDIAEKQKKSTWGSGFLDRLSKDLTAEFKNTKGFSKNNLQYILRWFNFYKDSNVEQVVPLLITIPWGHNLKIISKCNSVDEALYYVTKTSEHGWSRSILTHQIESDLFKREGKAITNFSRKLPKSDSDLANEITKDPYHFDFLTLTEDFKERELELELIKHIEKFLLELGSGFAFVGRQYKLTLSDNDYFLDLLFYHLELRCFVVIDLKIGEFKPEYAGKMNFYCNIIDDKIKKESDSPTIGMILCQNKDEIVVEYALKRVDAPMGVSEYQLTKQLPKEYKSSLPSIEEIEQELGVKHDK